MFKKKLIDIKNNKPIKINLISKYFHKNITLHQVKFKNVLSDKEKEKAKSMEKKNNQIID